MIGLLPYALVSRLIALLLLTAAVLKVQGLAAADAVARMGIFSTPEFQLAAIEFELVVAVWLLSGKNPLGSWLVALATFSCFAAVSFYLAWVGQTSCGCFGRLSVSPWYAFGLDVMVLAALAVGRPDLKPLLENRRANFTAALRPAALGLAGIVVFGGFLVAVAHLGFGSLDPALAYFRGERISIRPRLIDVGEAPKGENRQVTVHLTNWTDHPVQVFGGTTDCSCTVLGELPVTIPPNESRSVAVAVRMAARPGIFTRKASFLIDDEGFKRLDFRLTGRVYDTPAANPNGARPQIRNSKS